MALLKEVVTPGDENGENQKTLTYHRISTIIKETNGKNIIYVQAYATPEDRQKEKEYNELIDEGVVLTQEQNEELNEIRQRSEQGYFVMDYNEDVTISDLYQEFKEQVASYQGATDI